MVRSKALVLARELAMKVVSEVDMYESPAVQRLIKKGTAVEVACRVILTRSAENALALAKGDGEKARNALVIVNAKGNRLPQCVRLLGRYNPSVVGAAYQQHDELVSSTCSIVHLCRIIEELGYVPEEGDYQLAEILDEIATTCVSQKQEFFWLKRMPDLVREHGPFLDAILDYVLGEIRHQPSWFGLMTVEDEEEFWEDQISHTEEDR